MSEVRFEAQVDSNTNFIDTVNDKVKKNIQEIQEFIQGSKTDKEVYDLLLEHGNTSAVVEHLLGTMF